MFDATSDRSPAAGPECPPHHGGDVGAAEKRFGKPVGGWLDLSTGVNPHPFPIPALPADAWTRLPDSAAMIELKSAAGQFLGLTSESEIVPAPGTQSLIQWLPRLRPPSRVAVIGPTYGEHARSWRSAGHDVTEISDISDLVRCTSVLVLVNPNNPDGRTYPAEQLAEIAGEFMKTGGWLVVDEAFADGEPDQSMVRHLDLGGAVVLRSFGKFFGLPGLRLGFAAASAEIAGTIASALGPWPVSGAALAIATAAYRDRKWIDATRKRLRADSAKLRDLLNRTGFEVVGSTSLFCLARVADSEGAYEHLGRAGIYVRHFPKIPGLLRFGLPADEKEFSRLESVLDRRK